MEKRVVFRSAWLPYALVAPQIAITIVFFFWPAFQAGWYSFQLQDAFGLQTEFVERLENAGLGAFAGEDLRGALRATANRETFSRGIAVTHAKLVAKLQEFVAGDRFASGNEAVPPEYKDLVERYLRTLSAGGSK